MPAMKWWGWGLEELSFSDADKPGFGPYLHEHIGLDPARIAQRPVAFESLDIPEPVLGDELRGALAQAVGPDWVSTDPMDRVVHIRGKSLRDLVRQRRGDLGRVPDVVVRPADEAQVEAVLRAALDADAVLIPFGGGSSISGSLEAPAPERRTVVSVDMARLDRVLSIDETSRLARVQAPTPSRTRRSAAGSPRARRACSPTATATWPTSPARCASSPPPACSPRGPSRARPRDRACARWSWAARAGSASSPRRRSTSTGCPRAA
jgi:hypothetical protein